MPSVITQIDAVLRGREHIGFRVYFDRQALLATLSQEERDFLDHAKLTGDEYTIANFYLARLHGDYDHNVRYNWLADIFTAPRNAEEFMEGQCDRRGICRHKALILAAILQTYDITAEAEYGYVRTNNLIGGEMHVWTHIKFKHQRELVFDPTNEIIMGPAEYYQEYNVRGKGRFLLKYGPTAALH